MTSPTDRTARVTNMDEVRELIAELQTFVDQVDGVDRNVDQEKRAEKSRIMADRTRMFLYAGHQCDKIRVAIMDQYYVFRGTAL